MEIISFPPEALLPSHVGRLRMTREWEDRSFVWYFIVLLHNMLSNYFAISPILLLILRFMFDITVSSTALLQNAWIFCCMLRTSLGLSFEYLFSVVSKRKLVMGLGRGDDNAEEAHSETFTNGEEDEKNIKVDLRPCHIADSHRLLNSEAQV